MTDSWTGWFSPAVALVFLGIAALLVVIIWSIKRHRSPKLKIECSASLQAGFFSQEKHLQHRRDERPRPPQAGGH